MVRYTIKSNDPKEIIAELASEIELRKLVSQRQSTGTKRQYDSARFAGEIAAYEGLLHLLSNLDIVNPD